MTALPRTLLVVDVDVDPSVEAEFNRWYDEVHLPEIMSCPGFIRGARYVSERPFPTKDRPQEAGSTGRHYLSLYELADEDALNSAEFQAHRGLGPFVDNVRIKIRVYQKHVALGHDSTRGGE